MKVDKYRYPTIIIIALVVSTAIALAFGLFPAAH